MSTIMRFALPRDLRSKSVRCEDTEEAALGTRYLCLGLAECQWIYTVSRCCNRAVNAQEVSELVGLEQY